MTAKQLADKMKARRDHFTPALAATTRGLMKSAIRLSKERMTEGIYSQPIPTREQVNAERRHARGVSSGRISADTPFQFKPTARRGSGQGKPAWKRTGHLRRSETPVPIGPASFVIRNTAIYGLERHEAGKSDSPRLGHKPRNVRYVSHWQEEMAEVMRPICQTQWRETCLDVMRGKR